ncbi:MAG: sigma-54 dependent transcriptional regulator [Planctomycetota bacterium]
MSTILVVDDKDMLRDSVAVTLQRAGFTVVSASGGEAAIETVARKRPEAVVTDLKMPGMDGLELIERLRSLDDDLPIVLMTAYGTVETAVRAMKLGAYDYITKPFEGDELVIAVKRSIEHARVRRENAVLRAASAPGGEEEVGDGHGLDRVIGSSAVMAETKAKIATIASSHGTVLITGESGTGKEVAARAIHECSSRNNEPFLAVNCAAMSESLLESELFGHEKGAFTGADKMRKGRFELAHRGTLLLDEISEIRPGLQAKLLRVLQERAFERVGSSTTIGVDVRVIATSNRDLLGEVDRGRFRQDLYYRLNVLPVPLPALRDRAEDIRELAPYFVERVCAREGRPAKMIDESAMQLLLSYSWPGNVRELQNLCERAVVLSEGEVIEAALIRGWLGLALPRRPPAVAAVNAEPLPRPVSGTNGAHGNGYATTNGGGITSHPASVSMGGRFVEAPSGRRWLEGEPKPLADIEREVIVETLHRFGGHRQKTASALGIGVRTLGLKLKKWKEERVVPETL